MEGEPERTVSICLLCVLLNFRSISPRKLATELSFLNVLPVLCFFCNRIAFDRGTFSGNAFHVQLISREVVYQLSLTWPAILEISM